MGITQVISTAERGQQIEKDAKSLSRQLPQDAAKKSPLQEHEDEQATLKLLRVRELVKRLVENPDGGYSTIKSTQVELRESLNGNPAINAEILKAVHKGARSDNPHHRTNTISLIVEMLRNPDPTMNPVDRQKFWSLGPLQSMPSTKR